MKKVALGLLMKRLGMISFVILLFLQPPLSAKEVSCPNDIQLLNSPKTPLILKSLVEKYQKAFTNDNGYVFGVSDEGMLDYIVKNKQSGCMEDAASRYIMAAIIETLEEHWPEEVFYLKYFDGSSPPEMRYTLVIGVIKYDGGVVFIKDYYRWDGKDFTYKKTEMSE